MKKFSFGKPFMVVNAGNVTTLPKALALAVGFAFVGCDNGTAEEGSRFEGSWYSRDPSAPLSNYSCFTFHGNYYSFIDIYNGQPVPGRAMSGTFTFTNTEITFIPPGPNQWDGWTSGYNIEGDLLWVYTTYSPDGKFYKQ